MIGNDTAFTKNDLTINTHAIWFKVMDNESVWSDSVLDTLIVEEPTVATIGAECWLGSGYPIGGGPGFPDSFVVTDGNGTTRHYVADSAHFYNVMNDSLDVNDTIYIADNADINIGTKEWLVGPSDPDNITFCSGRGRTFDDTISWGGIIRIGKGTDEPFKFYNEGNLFSGLRIWGAVKYRGDHNYAGYSNPSSLKFFNSIGTVIENCEFIDAGFASTNFGDGCEPCTVRYSYFRRCRGRGDGYAINVAGDADVYIYANLFDFYRHAITSSTHDSTHYDASYCIFMEHDVAFQSCDMHTPGIGGDIHHMTWMAWKDAPDSNKSFNVEGFDMMSGTPVDSVRIWNCWSHHPDSFNTFDLSTNTNVRISTIHYGTTLPDGLSARIPTANGKVNTDSGDVSLTVTFEDDGSSDPNGSIAWYEWDFGIGDDEERIRNDSTQYTYTDIGRYIARLYVYDNDGIPDYEEIPIQVVPSGSDQDTFWLSFWYLDGYQGTSISDSLEAQCIVENDTLWLQSLNGDSIWKHYVVNITSQVASLDSITIEFRLVDKYGGNNDWQYFFVYFDDVWMWNGTVVNGDFEADGNNIDEDPDGWTQGETGAYFSRSQNMGTVVSGNMSMAMWLMVNSSPNDPNDYSYVRQKVDVLGQ